MKQQHKLSFLMNRHKKNTSFGHLLPLNNPSQLCYNHRKSKLFEVETFYGDFPFMPGADYKIFLCEFLLGLDRDTGKTTNMIIPDLA